VYKEVVRYEELLVPSHKLRPERGAERRAFDVEYDVSQMSQGTPLRFRFNMY